jgi:ISXO2-like transposase domain
VRQGTAWLAKHELTRATASRGAAEPKLSGRVEVDDADRGGARPGGKRGRGAAGRTPGAAAVETTPERLRLGVVKRFRKREAEKTAKRDLAAGSTAVGDGLPRWPAVEKAGCSHRPVATGSGERAACWAPFRRVDATLGNVRTAVAGA